MIENTTWIEIPTEDWEQTRAALAKHYAILRAEGNFNRVWVLLGPAVSNNIPAKSQQNPTELS